MSKPKNDQVSDVETAKILTLAREQLRSPGDWVEFGCYRGDTTVLLADLLKQTPARRLFAYDSFSGLPEKSPADLSSAGINFQPGALHVSRRALVDKLKRHGLHNVIIKKAWFSDLRPQDLPEKISFAFLDGDFYESQTEALALVISKLTPTSVIICHDYHNPELPGATKAVDDFLAAHPAYHLTLYHSLAILTH